MKRSSTPVAPSRQRGAASLIIVMLLFFVLSMVAAYTSRNLIFEQRTANNQYRSTQALEAADAGIEWAVAQLNAGRIDSSCAPSTSDAEASHTSFRERHLTVDPATGALTARQDNNSASVRAACVFNGTGWSCACSLPAQAPTALPSVTVTGPQPAFIVRLDQPSPALAASRPNVLELRSHSCTRPDTSNTGCLRFVSLRGATGDGVAAVTAQVTLRGALTVAPSAALTLGGDLGALPAGSTLTLTNTDTASNGVTLHTASSAAVPATGLVRVGLPGVSPANTSVTGDATLAPVMQGAFAAADRRFALFFGMRPDTYLRQPGLPTLDCSAVNCNAAAINTLMLRNPGRAVWLRGAGTVTIDGTVGVAGANPKPALLIVEGNLAFSSGTVNGLVFQRADASNPAQSAWSLSGNSVVNGALVAEGNVVINGGSAALAVNYNRALLQQLRVSYGTYVRVPGGWKDF